VDFLCGYCGANSLRLVGVTEKTVRVDCLSCGRRTRRRFDDANQAVRQEPVARFSAAAVGTLFVCAEINLAPPRY
jgi:hypothetical protein